MKSSYKMLLQRHSESLGSSQLTLEQETAVTKLVTGHDVIVILPTGEGKSLCFVTLPLIYNKLFPEFEGIVIVISPINERFTIKKEFYVLSLIPEMKWI